jgi:putative PIN family toxin of toxin-antitoxin system
VRVLLDTNVLIAAFVSHGICHDLLEHCFRHHQLVATQALISEFQETLSGKFRFSSSEVREALDLVRTMAEIVEATPLRARVCRDPDDDQVLEAALGGQVKCIVTGDQDLLIIKEYRGVRILSPSEFWRFESE